MGVVPERIIVEPKDKYGDLRRTQAILKVASALLPDTFVAPMHRVETFPGEPVFKYLDSNEAHGRKPFGFRFIRRLHDFNNTVKITTIVEKRGKDSQSVWIVQNTRLQMNTGRLSSSTHSYLKFPGEIEIAKCVFDTNYTPKGVEIDSSMTVINKDKGWADFSHPNSKFKVYKPRG